jgi:hypothetical protein
MLPRLSLTAVALLAAAWLLPATAEERPGLSALENTLELERKIDTARAAIIRIWLADKPHMAPYRDVIDAFMSDYLSWAALRDDFRAELASRFDAAELAEIERFYSTGPGRKLGPAIESILLAAFNDAKQRIIADQGKLQEMVRAEAQRIQELQKAQ